MANEIDDLEDIDRKILRLLQDNSRITRIDIAKDIGELTENAIRYGILKNEKDINNRYTRLSLT